MSSIKRIFLIAWLVLSSVFIFAESYFISKINYDIEGSGPKFIGATKKYALELNVPVDKNRVFESKDELEEYILDYTMRLNNTRTFESIDVKYEINTDNSITLNVAVKDSFHMIIIPYGRYDSNKGLVLKLKIKDTNFLGTMNPLSTDINMIIEQESETDDPDYKIGFNFKYNYPFKAGIFNAEWTNNDEFSYTFGDKSPEWNFNTGLTFTLPFDRLSYKLAFNQGFVHNFNYTSYGDEFYFNDDLKFSVPIDLYTIDNWGSITYEPFIDFNVNWDFDYIAELNSDLSSPIVSIGHSLKTGRVNWINNYRNGVSVDISNIISYNIQRQMWYPYISAEIKAYKGFELFQGNFLNRIGFTSDLYAFAYLMDYSSNPFIAKDGEKVGTRLRGIRDEQAYETMADANACKVPAAICLSLDMPYRIFQTNFTKKYWNYLNFDLQISPFIDMALTYNKYTKKLFDPKDGFYTAGVEVLVYPKKMSSFTVRGSLGVDIGRKLFADKLNNEWRKNISPFEIFIGVGLNY